VDYKIRPMVKEDRNELVSILDGTPEFTSEEKAVAIELIDIYLEQGELSGYHVLVVQMKFTVSGYICYGPTPMTDRTWDIYWIAVAPDKRRHGLGRALLEYTEKLLTEKSGRLVIIETSSKPEYERTRIFYDSMDYTIAARITDFYSVGDDKLILRKDINDNTQGNLN
jgi:ribosomal protein S18 acetylase RimI-like enzyme